MQQSGEHTRNRKYFIGLFIAAKGDISMDDLIADDLEKFIEDHPAWKSGWTRLGAARTIKRPFSWAWNKGLIDRHPLKCVTYEQGERMKPMSETDFRLLLRETSAEVRRALLFMWWTGCRPCEMAALEWSFIDIEKGVAILHKHKTAKSRKDRAARIIVLPDKALRLLTWMLDDQRTEQTHVFLNRIGTPWNRRSLNLRIYRMRKRIGLPNDVKLYGTRHSFGTRMALAGIELKTLSTLMGHTTTRMSEHYIHMAQETEHLHEALEKTLAHNKGKKDTP
jgi:integrase